MIYDETIRRHYDRVGDEYGLSPQSTMADEITRQIETNAILAFVSSTAPNGRLADVGCGNGYTLSRLAESFPRLSLTGFEPNRTLRALAESRFVEGSAIVLNGDLRKPTFNKSQKFDLLICQRVIINILNPEEQKMALLNAISAVELGGHLLFIEAFQSGLDRLNAARQEFELAPIPVAHHNLYLSDDFFDIPALTPYHSPDWASRPMNCQRIISSRASYTKCCGLAYQSGATPNLLSSFPTHFRRQLGTIRSSVFWHSRKRRDGPKLTRVSED